jgi:hypothetical protein
LEPRRHGGTAARRHGGTAARLNYHAAMLPSQLELRQARQHAKSAQERIRIFILALLAALAQF